MTPSERLMKSVVEAWGRADLRPLNDALHEDIVWKSASTIDDGRFRFGGVRRGRNQVLALLARISTVYFFDRYEAKSILSSGETVWGVFDAYGCYRPFHGLVARSLALEMAFCWRIRDGKILEAQTFFDTAALLVQQGELQSA